MKSRVMAMALLMGMVVMAAGQVQAQDEQRGELLSLLALTVKPGQVREFLAGVGAWKDCYLENAGEMEWSVWQRVQGKGTSYTAAFPAAGWAEFGAQDAADEACAEVASDRIASHVDESSHLVARQIPEMSDPVDDYSIVEVHNFRVIDHQAFHRIVNQVIESMRADEADHPGMWYEVEGGRGAPDYFVVVPFADFAALDDRQRNVWEIVERHRGEEETTSLREEFAEATREYWSYIYRRVDDLGHMGSD